MNATLIVLVGLAAGTYALKAAAPLALGDRVLPAWLTRFADLLPAALLAALVAVSTFADNGSVTVDARLAGVATAATALLLRAPFVVVVVAATAVTALVRLV